MKKNNNKKMLVILNRIITIVIAIGVFVMAYPFLSQMYYSAKEKGQAIVFEKNMGKITDKELEEKMKFYREYNNSLENGNSLNNKENRSEKEAVRRYRKMASEHEKIGYISVPKIDQNLPIFAGISDEMLEDGVGQMQGTSLPIGGRGTHSVLAAHSGLPNVRLFTDLKKVRVGDEFYITNEKETIAYKVDKIKVVLPTNFNDLTIEKGKDYVTLMTCTPYRVNTHRLLVRGHRIPYSKKAEEEKKKSIRKLIIEICSFAVIFVLAVIYIIRRIKKKKLKIGK